jgi:hypothetical protein
MQLPPGATIFGCEMGVILRPRKGTIKLLAGRYVPGGDGRPHCERLDDGSLKELPLDAKIIFVDKDPSSQAEHLDLIIVLKAVRGRNSALTIDQGITRCDAPVAILAAIPLDVFIKNCDSAEAGEMASLIDWDAYDADNERQ